jgi:hypothetical protein
MSGIAEHQLPCINYSADYTIQRQCGCRITWTGKSMHRKTRVMWCVDHAKYGQQAKRQKFLDDAQDEYRADQLKQEPK